MKLVPMVRWEARDHLDLLASVDRLDPWVYPVREVKRAQVARRESAEIAELRDSAAMTQRTDHVDPMDSQDSLAPQDRPE